MRKCGSDLHLRRGEKDEKSPQSALGTFPEPPEEGFRPAGLLRNAANYLSDPWKRPVAGG